MINISQITNFDLASAPAVSKIIHKGGDGTRVRKNYKVITQATLGGHPAFKLGYCVEDKGIGYPIFLTIKGVEKEFQVGQTGMYEFQPETWRDINDAESEEKIAEVEVTSIAVPADLVFTLDYCYYTA